VRGLLVAGVIGGAIVLGGASPAAAGGSWFDTVRDTHQPGDTVTLVGFTGGGSQGWVEDGPFYGYLQAADATATIVTGPRIPVGELTVDQTGRGGYLSPRAPTSSTTATRGATRSSGTSSAGRSTSGSIRPVRSPVSGRSMTRRSRTSPRTPC
jgi:hypothetical protein